jgi:inhibitor of cysteine peptidase
MEMKSKIVRATFCLVLVGITLMLAQCGVDDLGHLEISRFSSYEELKGFVETNTIYRGYLEMPGDFWGGSPEGGAEGEAPAPSDSGYSTTNIQVAGVDEADIVKTDGEYIYLVSENSTFIIRAYPPEQAEILSEIESEGTAIELFINGDRLVIFEQEMPYYDMVTEWETYVPYISPKVFVKVYDISDRETPLLQREFSANGGYLDSRMIGDYVYVVINEPVYEQDDEVNLPRIRYSGNETEIPATDIYYCNVSDYYYMYTTIVAINTQLDDQDPTRETILLGASSTLYASLNNIYLTFPMWGTEVGDSLRTTIHRIHIEDEEIEYVASGAVPGMVLNQFSMDEYDNYFRVATTTFDHTTENNIYVLNMSLEITGSLEDLASGETIYSARFMGERGYLVTFKQIDPLFVIDFSDPYDPEVLGYLKVTGYSDYLHPYDENHIIGVGKETTDAGEFAWYQGVKISLFDVTDVSNPVEIDKLEIGDRGTDSPVLRDHKAFLFDKTRNLLVMPILEASVNVSAYPEGVPSWAYGEPVYQGAYVFNISVDNGLQLKGRVTHIEDPTELEEYYYYYYYSPFFVIRSLYIDDVLYTISNTKIKMNNLDNLDYIDEVELLYSSNVTA